MSDKTKFWAQDLCVLFTDMAFFPTADMTKEEKLNALTRLVLVTALAMYAMDYKEWLKFLLIALLVIFIIQCSEGGKEDKKEDEVENFTIVPTYVGTDFQQTVVSPTFSEEWQIPPPAYDIYTNVPTPDTFDMPMKPQSYPYGQYLTRTNLLPSDEYYTHQGCGGTRTAREYINSTFLRHDLARQENMTRIFKKSLNRRFRMNCNDTFSPYSSY